MRREVHGLGQVAVSAFVKARWRLWLGLLALSVSAKSTEELAALAQRSLVSLSTAARSGRADGGLGTGFAISSNLIATSLHVIGEGRAVTVKLADSTTTEVLAVEAWDRFTDLAVLRVAASTMVPLVLGDDTKLVQGTGVVAMGNPLGFERSVVEGVLSARREIEGVEVLQLAIPIEPGNSGGPVLDREGQVVGLVNAKSALTRNLGFATPVSRLKPLLARPNPMAFARWLQLGELPVGIWEPWLGGQWRQKGGRILVEGLGTGFGGRALLYRTEPASGSTYEVSVRVRLADESGAAGLIFAGDGADRQYGFYPTGGQLRLTEFAGPDVFSWRIVGTKPVTGYRPGDWNWLRVRVAAGRVECAVNEVVVYEMDLKNGYGPRLGLVKFRDTSAQFRDFVVRTNGSSTAGLPIDVVVALGDARPVRWTEADLLPAIKTNLIPARTELARRARELELEAGRLRALGARAHREQVRDELVAALQRPDPAVDLVYCALLLAKYDQPELDVDAYRTQFEGLAQDLRGRLPTTAGPEERLRVLREFLFAENGFHGSRHDFENPANSYLNDVLDDREGLPITLSIVFLELAARIGLESVCGVPLPGHFLVKYRPTGGSEVLLDVFEGGRTITHDEADVLGSQALGVPVRSELIEPASKRAIIVRMLGNLATYAERAGSRAATLPYLDLLVAVAGDVRAEAKQRWERAEARLRAGDVAGTREDFEWILAQSPPGLEAARVVKALQQLSE